MYDTQTVPVARHRQYAMECRKKYLAYQEVQREREEQVRRRRQVTDELQRKFDELFGDLDDLDDD